MSKEKGKSHVQDTGSSPVVEQAEAQRIAEVRAALIRVGRLVVDHPIAQLGLRVGDAQQRRDIALITTWLEEQESDSGEKAD